MRLRNSYPKLWNQNFISSFSTAQLKQAVAEPSEKVKINLRNDSKQENSEKSPPFPLILEHAIFKKLQTKTVEATSKLSSFARGPIRTNLLVSLELLKLISAEQRLIPAISTWPQAKASYTSAFKSVKSAWEEGKLEFGNFSELIKNVTWGQVWRVLRISAEMASFYYIGELIGMLISFPFK